MTKTTGRFALNAPRPLPVLVLADVSGSMSADGKIDALNTSIASMVTDFAAYEDHRGEFVVGVVAFGGESAQMVQPPVPAAEFTWRALEADGRTPLGGALEIVADVIEDRDQVSSRSYRPTLVLVSDGQPNDEWEGPLAALNASERASKALRFAVAIGADADHAMLKRFVGDTGRVVQAHEATQIREFFRWVTMTVTSALTAGDYETIDALGIVLDGDLDELGG